jgi:hypothetical protein
MNIYRAMLSAAKQLAVEALRCAEGDTSAVPISWGLI